MRHVHFIQILIGLCVLALIGCKGEPPIDSYTEKKILVLGNSTEPQGLDPQIVTGVIESNIIRALFEGLCVEHPSKQGVHLPGVAEAWQANDDFTEWTFYLRKDGKWSDGKTAKTTTQMMRVLVKTFCNIPLPEGDTTISTIIGANYNK